MHNRLRPFDKLRLLARQKFKKAATGDSRFFSEFSDGVFEIRANNWQQYQQKPFARRHGN